ncbi:MAG: hypothetical protein LBQ88_00745, partial [Treponema sp.]|nr:hypothetical protein [Treponema sp.]
DFPGLNPYEKPSDFSPQTPPRISVPSDLRSAASCTARWSILSSKVGIPRSLWDFGEFLHEYAKIPINGALLGVCKV